jgi:hypothetical protein
MLYETVAKQITTVRVPAGTEDHLQTDASAAPGFEDRACSTLHTVRPLFIRWLHQMTLDIS